MKKAILNKTRVSILLLAVVYMVGIVSVISGKADSIMKLTWANLLFASAVFLANAKGFNLRYLVWFSLAFLFGFVLEVIGVHTGLIFGEYSYGEILGFKLGGVPLIIGMNWAVLVFASAALVQGFRVSNFIKTVLAAALMLSYDFLLEPVAIHFEMWTWADTTVPLRNYITWYLVAFVLLWGAFNYVGNLKNKIALPLLVMQVVFFIVILICYGLDT